MTVRNFKLLLSAITILAMILGCDKAEQGSANGGATGEGELTKLKGVTLTLEKINATTAYFTGVVKQMTPDLIVGIHWDYDQIEHISNTTLVRTTDFYEGGKFLIQVNSLPSNETIYYMPYVFRNGIAEYGDCLSFKTPQVTMTIEKVEVNGLEVVFKGVADLDGEGGILVSTDRELSLKSFMNNLKPVSDEVDKTYEHKLIELSSNTTYYYRTYYYSRELSDYVYGNVNSFTTGGPTIIIDKVSVSLNEVTFTGNVALDCIGGIFCTTDSSFSDMESVTIIDLSHTSENPYSRTCCLSYNSKYYYCTYYIRNDEYILGEIKSFTTGKDPAVKDLSLSSATDLSNNGTANCYIVSQSGLYKIKTVKGNDESEVLKNAFSPSVLWETFGTDETPSKMDLISGVCYKDGYLIFETSGTFREGNAVIAVADKYGNILWSWHIWMTDQPQGQVYSNNAGIMMDRNLGATSPTPGDIGALGLLYQWGRKDPFLGSSSIHYDSMAEAKSTLTWPPAVESGSSTGTVDYVISHPTTFVKSSASSEGDWHYFRTNNLWKSSDYNKSTYDPCPAGWRIPDGGTYGVWVKAGFDSATYDRENSGMSFSISSPSTTWYPLSGFRNHGEGRLEWVSYDGRYWAASTYYDVYLYTLSLRNSGSSEPMCRDRRRATGASVRCIKE